MRVVIFTFLFIGKITNQKVYRYWSRYRNFDPQNIDYGIEFEEYVYRPSLLKTFLEFLPVCFEILHECSPRNQMNLSVMCTLFRPDPISVEDLRMQAVRVSAVRTLNLYWGTDPEAVLRSRPPIGIQLAQHGWSLLLCKDVGENDEWKCVTTKLKRGFICLSVFHSTAMQVSITFSAELAHATPTRSPSPLLSDCFHLSTLAHVALLMCWLHYTLNLTLMTNSAISSLLNDCSHQGRGLGGAGAPATASAFCV